MIPHMKRQGLEVVHVAYNDNVEQPQQHVSLSLRRILPRRNSWPSASFLGDKIFRKLRMTCC
jgi:hypothetical protein